MIKFIPTSIDKLKSEYTFFILRLIWNLFKYSICKVCMKNEKNFQNVSEIMLNKKYFEKTTVGKSDFSSLYWFEFSHNSGNVTRVEIKNNIKVTQIVMPKKIYRKFQAKSPINQ